MIMTRWIDPFHEMALLARNLERGTSAEHAGQWLFPFSRSSFLPGRRARAYPLLNVREDNDALYVEALAPGVDPKSLSVTVENGRLTISGEKPGLVEKVEPEAYHRNERSAGRFTRSLELSAEVDQAKVKADYKNGLVSVTLPKAEIAKTRQIRVAVQ
jgi:HSP20 family protein